MYYIIVHECMTSQTSCADPPPGYFRVEFMKRKDVNLYGKYTFWNGSTQEDFLSYRFGDIDLERMHEVQDLVTTTPEVQYRLYPENPLHYGCYLASILTGNTLTCTHIAILS